MTSNAGNATMSESETPRTDAIEQTEPVTTDVLRMMYHARELERECSRLREERDKALAAVRE